MRADESLDKREIDSRKLENYIHTLKRGQVVEAGEWYKVMDRLGLTRSDTQRMTDLRKKKGLLMNFDKTKKGFVFEGWSTDFPEPQLSLL